MAQLFVIENSPGPAWTDGLAYRRQPGVDEHLAFMRSLHDRDVLVLCGPFLDEVIGSPAGMAIVRAASIEIADALAAEDPSFAAGLLRYRIRPWMAAMGTTAEIL